MSIFQTIGDRNYSLYSPLADELSFTKDKNYLFELDYFKLIDINGSQPLDFLQGQLTCDTREINTTSMRTGAQCNLKGRILSLVDVVEWQGIKLIMPEDLVAVTLSSLAKTAMLSRITLTLNQSLKVYGFFMQSPKDISPCEGGLPVAINSVVSSEAHLIYKLRDNFYLIVVTNHNDITLPFKNKNQLRGSLAWHYLQLEHFQMEIYPESRGLFLPHRLNLHTNSTISFDKGCYKGQEIIARTHYLAKQKYGLQKIVLNSTDAPKLGQALRAELDEKTLGEVIDFCKINENQYLIVASTLLENQSQGSLKLK